MEELLNQLKNQPEMKVVLDQVRATGKINSEEDLDMMLIATSGVVLGEMLESRGANLEELDADPDAESNDEVLSKYGITEDDIKSGVIAKIEEQL